MSKRGQFIQLFLGLNGSTQPTGCSSDNCVRHAEYQDKVAVGIVMTPNIIITPDISNFKPIKNCDNRDA